MSFLSAMRHLYTSFLQKLSNTTLNGDRSRTFAAFWLFGLINAMLYSVILSAALDLVGSRVPKGVVLLVDVAPTFLIKLLALPLNFHKVPYRFRIPMFTTLSISGMTLIGLTGTSTSHHAIPAKMLGIILASISSGGGDLSFLALTHYYGKLSIAAWWPLGSTLPPRLG
ncbi:CLN3 protein-domain-containing protein [Fusarium oxysporum]|nr:CLN3 protein-domain-containing protein [Fusarium oxysporum]